MKVSEINILVSVLAFHPYYIVVLENRRCHQDRNSFTNIQKFSPTLSRQRHEITNLSKMPVWSQNIKYITSTASNESYKSVTRNDSPVILFTENGFYRKQERSKLIEIENENRIKYRGGLYLLLSISWPDKRIEEFLEFRVYSIGWVEDEM